MQKLKYFFLIIDFGFIIYWLISALGIIPAQYLYNDYRNPILVNWNWSFFPLDIFISFTGFYSLYLYKNGNMKWKVFALISLVLTSISGLQAISHWVLAKDFDPTWWLPNLFLLIYPMFFLPKLLKELAK